MNTFVSGQSCNCKVLHLRSSGGVYGAEKVIVELAKNSKLYGFESIVGSISHHRDPYPVFLGYAEELGLNTINFKCAARFDLRCINSIRKYMRDDNINILHSHGYKENIYSVLAGMGMPKVTTNHLWKRTTFKSKTYCHIDRYVIRLFDRIVGVSYDIVDEMNNYNINNTSLVQNGVDTSIYRIIKKSKPIMKKYGLVESDLLLGMVSSLTPEKNHDYVLNAISCIDSQNIKLMIVGDGLLRSSLEQKVNRLGLSDKVIFTGFQDDIVGYMSVFDVFLLPSFIEGVPMALLEAMACGKIVVASKVGGISRVINHGENGFFVDINNFNDLVNLINELNEKRHLFHNYGLAARETIVENYSSLSMVAKYSDLYSQLIMADK